MQPKYDAGLHVCHHIGAEIAKRITQEAYNDGRAYYKFAVGLYADDIDQ